MASNEAIENEMRVFATGAVRNVDTEQIDPEGFLSPEVLLSFCDYMHKNRFLKNGTVRESDNWQLGISQRAYAKSLFRHFLKFWKQHRTLGNNNAEPSPYRNEQLVEQLNAQLFNLMGYLREELKKPTAESVAEAQRDTLAKLNGYSDFKTYLNLKVHDEPQFVPAVRPQLQQDTFFGEDPLDEDPNCWGV